MANAMAEASGAVGAVPRVLMVCEPPEGGAAANAVQLALRLGDHGFDVEYAGPPASPRYAELKAGGVPVHRLSLAPGYHRIAASAKAGAALTALIRRRRIAIVHSHSATSGVPGRVAAKLAGVPSIYSPHCFPFVGEFGSPRVILAVTVERALAPFTSLYICCCEDERTLALRRRISHERKLRVVLYGTPRCPRSIIADDTLLALRARGLLVGAVAVLRPQKRIDVLIDAAPEVLRRVPEARIAIVGSGPLESALKRRAAERGLLADDRFMLMPFEGPPERYLRALDLFVLPSSWEGMPIGLIEAMACGVPQVATAVNGTPEALTPATGILVPPDDPAAMAEAIVRSLQDAPGRTLSARRSVERHDTRFRLERMVGETARVYQEALDEVG